MKRLEADLELRNSVNDDHVDRYKQYRQTSVYEIREYLTDSVRNRVSRTMLNSVVVYGLDYMAEKYDDMRAFRYAEELLAAFKSLQPTRFAESRLPKRAVDPDLVSGFSGIYGDRHGLVDHYSRQLRENMQSWMTSRATWNAPYTSLVNSSMTGKSRLEKQLAIVDPVIYFCLRKSKDRSGNRVSGYPVSTVRWVRRFIANPYKLKERYIGVPVSPEEHDFIEKKGVTGHLYFFSIFLKCLLELIRSPDWKVKEKKDKREALWHLLAEPAGAPEGLGNLTEEASGFWETVRRAVWTFDAGTRKYAYETSSNDDSINSMKLTSEALIFELCDSNVPAEQVILMVFDEARMLTTILCDGQAAKTSISQLSRFRLLRRSLRIIGQANIRIFSILTDTSSRLTNFQPKNDNPSARDPMEVARGGEMFAPLIIMPTIDLAANDLAATCDPSEVQKASRLALFGRVAWSVMLKTRSTDSVLRLAITKLMVTDPRNIDTALYAAASTTKHRDQNFDRKFLACLGPRLALQIGSCTQDARELVASHMMYLEHDGDDHVQLFTRYLSEPILAEASARATGEYGWDIPLEYLIYKLQHGVVDAAFRGEFVTKAILCVSCEDAQRAKEVREKKKLAESTTTHSSSNDSWTYSTPVTVQEFLNSLFRSPEPPAVKRKRTDDAHKANPEVDEDSIPPAESLFVDDFLNPGLKIKSEDTKHLTNRQAAIGKFLNSHIFFNHWIRTNDVLRPSVLIKAWNRNAAIMCENGATGIDFVIPVMMEWSHNTPEASQLGKCTKPWDEEQQRAASKVISYVLIQTKNRKSSCSGERLDDIIDAVPLKRGLSKHPNFVDHDPWQPFLSILFDFRVTPARRPSLELTWTRCALEAKLQQAVSKVTGLQKSVKDKKSPVLQKAQTESNVLKARVNIATHQIPIVSYGLNGSAFKCLETRPRLTAKLNELLTVPVDPLYDLRGPVRLELLESRACVSDADRRMGEPSIAQVE